MTNLAGAGAPLHELDTSNHTEPAAKFIPGQPDMWAFVLFETLVFTSYFTVYLLFRGHHHADYLHSQADLDLRIGVFNTIVLLTSSWSIARCVQASREGRYSAAIKNACLTTVFGVVFFIVKVCEWINEIHLGNTFGSSEFFEHYFFLTSIHCLHLLIGFIVMAIVVYQLKSPNRRSQELIETGATYWHTVDFLWVLIFALLYVVR